MVLSGYLKSRHECLAPVSFVGLLRYRFLGRHLRLRAYWIDIWYFRLRPTPPFVRTASPSSACKADAQTPTLRRRVRQARSSVGSDGNPQPAVVPPWTSARV